MWSSRARSGCASPNPDSTKSRVSSPESSPDECVFLDDLGINLKPARAMGMQTIKVGKPGPALDELTTILGIPLNN